MAEWLIENGIGEERALLYRGGQVVAARLRWPGALEAGSVEDAVLSAKPAGSVRGRAIFSNGEEALVDKLPRNASEGSTIRLIVTRSAIREGHRRKLAQARPADAPCSPAPTLVETLAEEGVPVKPVRQFPSGDWDDVWSQAWEGRRAFAGGTLECSVTPAMTLIDIDGELPPRELAMAATQPLALTIGLFDFGGSIGVDFPTLSTKADRKAVDTALGQALGHAITGLDHERTAMNGFGFVQLVSRFARPSLLHLMAASRTGAAARMAVRRAEQLEQGGRRILLTVHPAIKAHLKQVWLDELARRTGREIAVVTNPAIALEAGHAQIVADD